MSKKKVAIDVNSVMPLYRRGWLSGIGRTTKELVEALDRMEELPFELTLFSQNTKNVKPNRMGTRFSYRHLPLPHKEWVNKWVSALHLREGLMRYDLFHVPHNFEWVAKPEKTVVTIHDALFFAHPDEVYDYKYAQRNYPKLARSCRGIITCSESSKHDIMQYMDVAEERIFVCPWGYNRELFHPQETEPSPRPYFLSVSCSMGRKNTLSIVKAYERLLHQHPRHELRLVWSNPPKEALDYCQQKHLNGHIRLLTQVDDLQLAKLYCGASATFFLSRYEGFGLPVLESMACGTPVVTCRNSALTEVGGDAAFYVEPDDGDGICRYMELWENGTVDLEDLQQRCLRQASQFSWERCAAQTVEVYSQLMQ